MKLIIVSKTNVASTNIGKIFRKKYDKVPGVQIFETEKNVLEFDRGKDFPKVLAKNPELIIVASSHKSEVGIPMLNCHTTGNWNADTSYGGKPNTLSIAPALYLRAGILELAKLKTEDLRLKPYEIGMEVTHHGPTLDNPVIFVEVGSSEKEWNDLVACEAAANVIYKLVSEKPEKVPVAVGFGGGHYCPAFNRALITKNCAFGHICPKYAADFLDEGMVLQAFNKTIPKPDFAAIEWKGLSSEQRKKIIGILDRNKIPWKKI